MLKKIVLAFVIFSIAIASAAGSYKVTLSQPSVVNGKELKAGEYRLNVTESKVTISSSKESVEVPAKVENGDQKFDTTAIRYSEEGGKQNITEIRLGGTKTKLVFNR